MEGYLTTKQAAERLNVSDARIRQLIIEGDLKGEKVGRDNFIAIDEIKRFESLERKAGRPKKSK